MSSLAVGRMPSDISHNHLSNISNREDAVGSALPALSAIHATRRPKLLVSAYACHPTKGSEQCIGWNWAQQLAAHAEVWVVTRQNRRSAIEAYESSKGPIGVHWVYLDGSPRLLWLKAHVLGIATYYHIWQHMLLRLARRLHAEVHFDATFHLTMNGFREPGYLWKLPCAFIWGPVGGLQNGHEVFFAEEPLRARVAERMRTIINKWLAKHSARPRQARARALLLMAANSDALQWARKGPIASARRRTVLRLLETGVGRDPAGDPAARDTHSILWVGSDEARKNQRFALKAFSLLRLVHPHCVLTMVGVSPALQQRLTSWAQRRGVSLENVRFHQRVPRHELAAFYRSAALFWFTSYRDTSGNVLLEALSHGTACMAFNHQGAGDILADGAGELIAVGAPSDMLRRWTQTACELIADCARRDALGRAGAKAVVERFPWDGKSAPICAALATLVMDPSRR